MLSHKPVLSVTRITISVLSLTSTPLSAVAQHVRRSRRPGSAVSRSSSVNWNRSVGRRRDDGSNLSSPSTNKSCPDSSFAGNPLIIFQPVTDEFVVKIINLPSLVNSIPIPPCFFLKTLTSSCRLSRTSSTHLLPHDLKTAIVKPLLKMPSLDKNLLKNYCPISKLPFLSKIFEKVVLHKLPRKQL